MSRLTKILAAVVTVLLAVMITFFNWEAIQVSYHQWRMNSAYNTLFGNPQPTGNGLASHDVTGVDVDSVMNAYETHRNILVGLNVLHHTTASFPNLASDGSIQQSDLRSDFVHRMWQNFPSHKHYYLAGDGSFETWILIDAKNDWDTFIAKELANIVADSNAEQEP